MALRGFDRAPVEIGAVELPKVQVRSAAINAPPADGRDAFEVTMDEHSFGMGIVEAVIVPHRAKSTIKPG